MKFCCETTSSESMLDVYGHTKSMFRGGGKVSQLTTKSTCIYIYIYSSNASSCALKFALFIATLFLKRVSLETKNYKICHLARSAKTSAYSCIVSYLAECTWAPYQRKQQDTAATASLKMPTIYSDTAGNKLMKIMFHRQEALTLRIFLYYKKAGDTASLMLLKIPSLRLIKENKRRERWAGPGIGGGNTCTQMSEQVRVRTSVKGSKHHFSLNTN